MIKKIIILLLIAFALVGCKTMPEVDVYVGDDPKAYQYPYWGEPHWKNHYRTWTWHEPTPPPPPRKPVYRWEPKKDKRKGHHRR